MVQVSEDTGSTRSETDQIDSDLYAAIAVPSVWTQQTAGSDYAVAVESGEAIIESGTTKNYVAPALYYLEDAIEYYDIPGIPITGPREE